MYSGIKDKVIIVTGASGQIGKEVANFLYNQGAQVIATDINAPEDTGYKFLKYDVSNQHEIDLLIEYVRKKYDKIDGLVNLAYPRTEDWGAKFEDIDLESWKKNVDTQLNSVFYICQKVLSLMKIQKSGSIVNIGSIYGVVGNDFTIYEGYGGTSPAAYSAIKGGLINFTRYLASYYGKDMIRVNCISPGGILNEKSQHPDFIKRYSEKSPLKRLGYAREIAAPVAFLLSEDASFITGHNLMVDGGWTAI
ncbi:SDR family oxidoreductase [uncultured Christiangramia sp.]|uniref:SDR family oxidoreductase n=1 Tax=Christiangramia sp. 3-2217-3z TaxID=3417564 RepID=UPI00260D02AB|nr:SDR family oxidoreductase [uncultured Christiangramia sp.]